MKYKLDRLATKYVLLTEISERVDKAAETVQKCDHQQ